MATITATIPVPVSGFGAAASVQTMTGPKTVGLTGRFRGAYVLYGTHDGTNFAPICQFDAGGVEGLKTTVKAAMAQLQIRSLASDASDVTAFATGESVPGDFVTATLATLLPGASGPQPSVFFSALAYQAGLNFILVGGLEGKLVIEGSADNVRWDPIGQFSVDSSGPSLLGQSLPEFSPLESDALVRYLRVNVLGRVTGTGLVVTAGASKSGGGASVETLAQTYQVGSSISDQTLVLTDSRGGPVGLYAAGSLTGDYALKVVVPDGALGNVGAAFRRTGGISLGPDNILVDLAADPSTVSSNNNERVVCIGGNMVVPDNSLNTVAIGYHVTVGANGGVGTKFAVAIGDSTSVEKNYSIAVGYQANSSANAAISIGSVALASGDTSIAIGSSTQAMGVGAVALGTGAYALAHQFVVGAPVNGYSLFEVVSDLAGAPDLFKFESGLGSNGDTALFLLCKATTSGAVALQQVTLAAPSGGYSALRVANA